MTVPIGQQLQHIRRLPYGTARTSAAEAIARRIEAEGPRERLAEALLDLVEAYTFAGQGEKSFVIFARALRLWDAAPELFDESDTHNLFWEFKWVAGDLADYPQISVGQAEAFLDDMQRRFELQGNGFSAVRAACFAWTWHSGAEGAEEARLTWITSPRDPLDDCHACMIGRQTDFLVEQGRFREALDLGITQDSSCNIEPTKTFHAAALAALNLGEAAQARELHGGALASETGGNRGLAHSRGQSFELLARGGQLERALRELRGDYRELLTDSPSPLEHLRFLLGLLAGLSANLDRGDTQTGIALPGASGAGHGLTVSELHAWARQQAASLVGGFDARSGTTYYGRLLDRALSSCPAESPLDFGPDSRVAEAQQEQAAAVGHASLAEGETAEGATAEGDSAGGNRAQQGSGWRSKQGTGRTPAKGLAKLWDRMVEKVSGMPQPDAQPAHTRNADEPHSAQLTGDGLVARGSEHAARGEYAAAARDYTQAMGVFEAGGWLERAGLAAAEAAQCAALDRNEERAHALFAEAIPLLRSGGADTGTLAAVLAAWAPAAARMNDAESQILATAAALESLPECDVTGLTDELAARRTQEWSVHRATLRDTLARSIAAGRRRTVAPGLDSDRAAAEALRAGEEFARVGMLADASHAFWLAGKIEVDRGDTEAAVWGFESAFEGFTAAGKRTARARVAGELIELLRATGQAGRAEEIVAEL